VKIRTNVTSKKGIAFICARRIRLGVARGDAAFPQRMGGRGGERSMEKKGEWTKLNFTPRRTLLRGECICARLAKWWGKRKGLKTGIVEGKCSRKRERTVFQGYDKDGVRRAIEQPNAPCTQGIESSRSIDERGINGEWGVTDLGERYKVVPEGRKGYQYINNF